MSLYKKMHNNLLNEETSLNYQFSEENNKITFNKIYTKFHKML